jgi:hypothetical protein
VFVPVMTVPGDFPASLSTAGLRQTDANEVWHDEPSVEPGAVCPSPRDSAVSA